MFLVSLTFSDKSKAPLYMEGHKSWLQKGFDDGTFLLSGSLADGTGGAILANAPSTEALQARLAEDPFVSENVVTVSVIAFTPSRAEDRLSFLLA